MAPYEGTNGNRWLGHDMKSNGRTQNALVATDRVPGDPVKGNNGGGWVYGVAVERLGPPNGITRVVTGDKMVQDRGVRSVTTKTLPRVILNAEGNGNIVIIHRQLRIRIAYISLRVRNRKR